MKVLIFSLALLLGTACTTTIPKPVDITTELSDADAEQLRRLLPWIGKAQVHTIGDYVIIAPAADPGPIIYLLKDGKPFVLVDHHPPGMPGLAKEGQVVISLFRNSRVLVMDTGASITISETANEKLQNIPRVSLSDFDGDGIYDRLLYSVFDEEGNVMVNVMDFDLDGQADFKLKQKGDKTESFAWIEARWRLIEKKNGAPGAVSDEGKWKPIERQGATWKYLE